MRANANDGGFMQYCISFEKVCMMRDTAVFIRATASYACHGRDAFASDVLFVARTLCGLTCTCIDLDFWIS